MFHYTTKEESLNKTVNKYYQKPKKKDFIIRNVILKLVLKKWKIKIRLLKIMTQNVIQKLTIFLKS